MIQLEWAEFKNFIQNHEAPYKYIELEHDYKLFAKDDWFGVTCILSKTSPKNADQLEFETSFKTQGNQKLKQPLQIGEIADTPPFHSKTLNSGQKLFRRKHGTSVTIPANSTATLEIVVPYGLCKVNEVELINCSAGDSCDLKVYDNSQGTISTIPNLVLNQFGFAVQLPDGIYRDKSNYDADMILGMKIEVLYTNNTNSEKQIGMNVTLHELV